MNNIDDEYERFVEHLHDYARKAKSFKTKKRHLSLETLELIRQCGAARGAEPKAIGSLAETWKEQEMRELSKNDYQKKRNRKLKRVKTENMRN
ncbi:hypothetical protein NECAME_13917 [Necator americanus]|uniref:Uncharacterized protein n=1 Tax=Necator americanus TaxID=51031 RepID=W2SRD4_NECAM|nr:hypothetical protein NECAME_13917 [Necator americanus]ETN72274.1 hypothetical protein NECAME_13917 [Necator americanus]